MTPEEWKELERAYELKLTEERIEELLKKTEEVDEHPEDYDGPCWCQLCCSYADIDEES